MPNHDDTGGLSVGQRITRIEEEHRAHAEHCEISRTDLWEAIDNKAEASEVKEMNTKIEKLGEVVTESKWKLVGIVLLLSFVGTILGAVAVHFAIKALHG